MMSAFTLLEMDVAIRCAMNKEEVSAQELVHLLGQISVLVALKVFVAF